MHKFFCRYNNVTENYELSNIQGQNLFNRIRVQAEDELLPKIQKCLLRIGNILSKAHIFLDLLQRLLSDAEPILSSMLSENESQSLAISNMHYQIFNAAMPAETQKIEEKDWPLTEVLDMLSMLLLQASDETTELEKNVNIEDLNRICLVLQHSISNQVQKILYLKSKYCPA